jgi:hypothetical protein
MAIIINAMDGRARKRHHQKEQIRSMHNSADQESGGWLENRGFGVLDWASQNQSVVVLDPYGKVLEDFEINQALKISCLNGADNWGCHLGIMPWLRRDWANHHAAFRTSFGNSTDDDLTRKRLSLNDDKGSHSPPRLLDCYYYTFGLSSRFVLELYNMG